MNMLLILAASALQAGAPPPAPAAEPPATELPEIKVTCRTERVTGTRVVKKVCRNPEQQRQADRDARNRLRMGSQVQATEAFKRPSGE